MPSSESTPTVKRWGLGTGKRNNWLRFCTFSFLHLGTYVSNLGVLIWFVCALQGNLRFGLVCYVTLLGLAQLLVGVYCAHLSWRDSQVTNISKRLCGTPGRILACAFLGLTQLIQLKVAHAKYTLREEMPADGYSEPDDERANGNSQLSTRRRELQQIAMLENIAPWAFPSKCFEGILEGSIFALVLLYAMLKANWHGGESLSELRSDWPIYLLGSASGLSSLGTIGISVLNFDYHLSPAVQKVVDHSVRYTILHALFRACESASRIVLIAFFSLGLRNCGHFLPVVPYLILALDYLVCVVLLLTLSPHGHSQSFLKRLVFAMFMGLLLLIANLAEFVDEAERGVLQAAAAKLAKAIRSLRFVQFAMLVVFFCVGFPCKCVLDDSQGRALAPRDFREVLLTKHYMIFWPFLLANVIYWSLAFGRFHRLPRSFARHQAIPRAVARLLDLPNLICCFEGSGDAPSVLHIDSDTPMVSLASTGTVSSRRLEPRQLQVTQANDADLPESMRADILEVGTDSFPFNSRNDFRLRRAPDLTALFLSRGVAGPIASALLTPIDENIESIASSSATPLADSPPPEVIALNDFEDLGLLDKGQYAPVSKCQLKRTEKVFAMKRLTKHQYCVQQNTMVAQEHATLLVAGRHANVASLEWAFETDTYWILIMEYCDLGSLGKFIKDEGDPGLALPMTRRLGEHVCLGLDHLHQHHILHRDVKPDNVGIVGPKDSPVGKLIDFGFAKCADACQAKTIVGSYGYAAPEIEEAKIRLGAFQQAERYYDGRIDLYSFGILLFVTFVGREAIYEDKKKKVKQLWTHRQFQKMLKSTEPDTLWHCKRYQDLDIEPVYVYPEMEDAGLLYAISKLTSTDPNERPRTAGDAAQLPFFQCHEGSSASQSLRSGLTT